MTTYIVQTASAHMPRSVKAPYRRVAVIQVQPGVTGVSMISKRARGVIQIVQTWERCHAHGTNNAYLRAYLEACQLAIKLNSAHLES